MRISNESQAAHPQNTAPDWAEGVHALFKAQHVHVISFVPDGGHKRLIELCQGDKDMRTVVLTTEEEGIAGRQTQCIAHAIQRCRQLRQYAFPAACVQHAVSHTRHDAWGMGRVQSMASADGTEHAKCSGNERSDRVSCRYD